MYCCKELQEGVRAGCWAHSWWPLCMVFVAARCVVLSSWGTTSAQVLHYALQRPWMEKERVVKTWFLRWFGSFLSGLRSAHEQPCWLGVVSSCGTLRATLQPGEDVFRVLCWAELGCLWISCLHASIGLEENWKKPSCHWKHKAVSHRFLNVYRLHSPHSWYLWSGS